MKYYIIDRGISQEIYKILRRFFLYYGNKIKEDVIIKTQKEKIRKAYQKNNIIVNDETIEAIMQDKKRTEGLIRLYKDEEIDSMNYILEKPKGNLYFTKFEVDLTSKIDLFNKNTIEICRDIYKNRNNNTN